jgi:ABC-2 type transport system permease protein
MTARRPLRDSLTMLRREFRHAQRYPALLISGIAVPVLFLLLFDGVWGGTLSTGLGTAHGGYIDYVLPGILAMTAASTAEGTALSVCTDMTTGIITRFRTMAITRTSVLTGQVVGGLVRALVSAAFVVGVAFAMGFRSSAGVGGWLAAAGVFAMLALALTWLTVAFGLLARTPAGANSLALIIVVLPFISSAFVPTGHMPAGVAWLAQNQPFTPVIDTLRGLLGAATAGDSTIVALLWCAGLAAVGYLWSRALFNRLPSRQPAAVVM